ncbi:MAG: leucine-rich repeat domain-containing protein [Clostridia bacterium]|nr:leucine-rich repeat domain-containing protein [Clostridia bacterium]
MKKILSAALFTLLLFSLSLPARTEETEPESFKSGDYTYIVPEDGTAQITSYGGDGQDIVIPDKLSGYPVRAIGDSAFYRCSCLTSVTIPDSVVKIGTNPFAHCRKLSKVKVSPDHPTLAVIDDVLFSKQDKRLICYPMGKQETEYQIPSGIKIIGEGAFYECSSLASVSIPDSVTFIGEVAFYECSSLASIYIPNSVTFIGEGAFLCSNLASISIPDSVTSIEDYTFCWCFSLASINIPNSVTSIGDCAFDGCSNLASISIPDSVTSIGDDAFSGCPNLTLTVVRDSYAARYCKEIGLNYTYTDSLDWLNN